MIQLFTDVFSLFRLAKGIEARQSALGHGKSEAEANIVFQDITFMCYITNNQTIDILEENANLRSTLIDLLSTEIALREFLRMKNKDQAKIAELIMERDNKWERYEFLRRLSAFEYRSLIIDKVAD